MAPADRASPLRLGVAGFGRVVERYHLPAIDAGCGWKVAAVADAAPARRAAARVSTRCESLEAMADAADLDAVLIATPPDSHAALTRLALERGLHVLVEKPMATTREDAEQVVDDAKRAGRQVVVGFNRRFRRTYDEARRAIAGREVRAVRHAFIADVRQWREPGAAPASLDATLHDTASHQVDLLPWLLDRRIAAIRSTARHDGPAGTVVDYEIEFEDGLLAACRTGHAPSYRERLEIEHDGGGIVVVPGGLFHARRPDARSVAVRGAAAALIGPIRRRLGGAPGETAESFRRQLAAFADLVRGIAPDVTPAGPDAGLHATSAVIACGSGFDDPGVRRTV